MTIQQLSARSIKKPELRELCTQVLERTKNPHDIYEITATLESIGWNDKMARDRFGHKDLFSLAEELWDFIKNELHIVPMVKTEKMSTLKYFLESMRSFLRGTIFALPMAVSVISMLTLRFSLWSYENLTVSLATSISIGTILSFVVVGGFTQALARRGFMYLGQNLGYMARKTAFYFVRLGFYCAIAVTIGFYVFNWLFKIFPWSMASIIILYYFFLTVIWLSVTIMYMLRKEIVFTGLITAGIGLVFVLFILLKIDIIISQLIALSIVSVAGFFISRYYFYQTEKMMEKGIAPSLPRRSLMLYSTMPYFKYGFFYFLFLNLDRIIAWSTNETYMPYIIWFRGEYELGLDFALLVLILPMGFVEVIVNEIMIKILVDQKNFSMNEIPTMNNIYKKFHRKWTIFVSLFGILNGIILFLFIRYIDYHNIIHLEILGNRVTLVVLILAILSYSIISLGLLNCLILFSFSQPQMAGHSIMVATAVNAILGFVLSRWVDYYWAVIGLVIGSIVFAVLSFKRVSEVFSNLDYYLYNAQ
ncbi:MAG: hypothetical protein APF84_10640 [Gracilibacter sp. BRH_c7a]|nr:MAG: hypothetical protein APF84_10640 [Gracilibacter sp. BRH_c7a]